MSDTHRCHNTLLLCALLLAIGSATAQPVPLEIPDTPAGRILTDWLEAHNRADRDALTAWVRQSHPPGEPATHVLTKRVDWYLEAAEMFGPLIARPHRVVEDEPHRLVVHLLSVELRGQDPDRLDPTQVIKVEVDVDPQQPDRLQRGLGIGPLACELRR